MTQFLTGLFTGLAIEAVVVLVMAPEVRAALRQLALRLTTIRS
jgi:hypothetical protein